MSLLDCFNFFLFRGYGESMSDVSMRYASSAMSVQRRREGGKAWLSHTCLGSEFVNGIFAALVWVFPMTEKEENFDRVKFRSGESHGF